MRSEKKAEDCWAISCGEYSSYTILAVFTKKEDAEAFLSLFPEETKGYGGAFIESFPINPGIERVKEAIAQKLKSFTVSFSSDGNLKHISEGKICLFRAIHFSIATRMLNSLSDPDVIKVLCFAREEEHALKIAADARREFIANEELESS